MKKIKENIQLILIALVVACGLSACVNINELPPEIESSMNVQIKFPDPPALTEEESVVVNQIKREYDANTK